MSNLAELMNGRTLEHDFGFSNSGPMSGLVDGVQSISMGGATVTLSFDETNTQMKCSVLSCDPAGAAVALKLPATLSDTTGVVKTLAGRRIVIHNSADSHGENVLIQDSAAKLIGVAGPGASVEVILSAHAAPYCTSRIFETSVLIASGTDYTAVQTVIPALGATNIAICDQAWIYSNGATTNSNTFDFQYASGTANAIGAHGLTIADGKIGVIKFDTDIADAVEGANAIVQFNGSANASTALTVRIFFRLVNLTNVLISDSIT